MKNKFSVNQSVVSRKPKNFFGLVCCELSAKSKMLQCRGNVYLTMFLSDAIRRQDCGNWILMFYHKHKEWERLPWDFPHNPIKCPAALISSPQRPMRNSWGEATVLWSNGGGWLHARVWESVKSEGNREMIVRGNEKSGAEWIVCAPEIKIQLCDSNSVRQKQNYHLFDRLLCRLFVSFPLTAELCPHDQCISFHFWYLFFLTRCS